MPKLTKKQVSSILFGYPTEELYIRTTEETGLRAFFSPAGEDVWTSKIGGETQPILTSFKVVKYFLDTDFKEIAVSYKVDGITKESVVYDASILPEKKSLHIDLTNLETGAKKLIGKLPFTISVEKKKKK